MSSLRRLEGYLLLDHRSSPGLPKPQAERIGAKPGSTMHETKTLWCAHCSTHFLPNPTRARPREFCRKCDAYVCDNCARVAATPDYVHRSFKEIADLVRSGKYTLAGSASNPILIPT